MQKRHIATYLLIKTPCNFVFKIASLENMLLFSTTNNLIYLSCHSHNFHVFAIAKKDNNLICFIVQLLLCASISTGIVYLTDTREINMIIEFTGIKILMTRNYENFPSENYKHLVIMMMRGEGGSW